jgi:predicted methyltransferase
MAYERTTSEYQAIVATTREYFFTGLIFIVSGVLNFSVVANPLLPPEQSVRPGINKHYENPKFQDWVNRFERPGREVYDKRYDVIDATGVKPGMAVADIGAGTGLFTRLFSARVGPKGQVIAVDISRVFVENVLRIAKEQGLKNIEGIVNTPRNVSLSPDSIDLAFVCDTYHHFEYPESTLKSIRHALRPEGALIVIDFRKIPGFSSPWVMNHVRTDKKTVIKEIGAAGFKLIEERPLLRSHYFLRFIKTRGIK